MSRTNKIIVLITVAAAVSVLSAADAIAQMKIGYIRSDYIFSQYEPYKEAQKQLDSYQKNEFGELQKMKDELDKKVEDARSKELLMTPEMKQQKLEELSKQGEELEQRYEALMDPDTGLMVKKQTELMQPIIDRINEVLLRIAKEEEYDFIFDATIGPEGNTILFANEKYDISEQILEELKSESGSN